MIKDRIILASGSPRRKALLERIGIIPEIIPSDVDESVESENPEEIVKILSRRKAEAVASDVPEGKIVLGADTVVAADGKVLGKPVDHRDAARMIRMLSGKTHQVYTGVTLISVGKDRSVTFAEKTDVHVYPMSDREIETYAQSEEPMDKAGGYGIQGAFSAFIRGIDGDYSNVVGLPVGRVWQELKKFTRI